MKTDFKTPACGYAPDLFTEYDSQEKLPDQTIPLADITSNEEISENGPEIA